MLAGGFSFTTSSGVSVDDGALSSVATFTADVMQVTVTNAHLFAGVGGSLSGADSTTVTDGSVGLSASGITVHLVTAKNTTTPAAKYTGLYLTVGSATLTGLDPIEVHLKDAFVKYNKVSVVGAPSSTGSEHAPQAFEAYGVQVDATIDVSVGAAAIGLNLGGGLVLAGGFSFTTSSGVPVDDGALSSVATFTADVMQVTVTNAHLFAGVGGSLSGADSTTVTAAAIPLVGGQTWTAHDMVEQALIGHGHPWSTDEASRRPRELTLHHPQHPKRWLTGGLSASALRWRPGPRRAGRGMGAARNPASSERQSRSDVTSTVQGRVSNQTVQLITLTRPPLLTEAGRLGWDVDAMGRCKPALIRWDAGQHLLGRTQGGFAFLFLR